MNKITYSKFFVSLLRVMLGFIFLWAFVDKVFGLGFATKSGQAWIDGVSPTAGFLGHAVQGPFAPFFHSLAGLAIVDWMFMLGLLFIGLTLLTKKYLKWGCVAGFVLVIFMYLSLLWPANNPIIDEHLIYAAIFGYFFFNSES